MRKKEEVFGYAPLQALLATSAFAEMAMKNGRVDQVEDVICWYTSYFAESGIDQ